MLSGKKERCGFCARSQKFKPPNFADNSGLQVHIIEYFAGENDDTYDDGLSSDEGIGKF